MCCFLTLSTFALATAQASYYSYCSYYLIFCIRLLLCCFDVAVCARNTPCDSSENAHTVLFTYTHITMYVFITTYSHLHILLRTCSYTYYLMSLKIVLALWCVASTRGGVQKRGGCLKLFNYMTLLDITACKQRGGHLELFPLSCR